MNQHAAFKANAESRIVKWLTAAKTSFVQHCRIPKDKATTIDFLITDPHPFAIEVTTASSGPAVQRRHKRFLALRLQLAEAFGIDLPLISICEPGATRGYRTMNPYADVTLCLDDGLPSPSDCAVAPINPDVRRIFQSGQPPPSTLTSQASIEAMLRRAVTLTDLRAGQVDKRNEDAEFVAEGLKPQPIDGYSQRSSSIVPSPHEVNTILDRVLQRLTLRTRTERMTTSVTVPHGRLKIAGLRKGNGRLLMLRPFFVSGDGALHAHKLSELLADAWLLRSQGSLRIENLCLLLIPLDAKTSTTIRGTQSAVCPHVVSLCMDCETLGWRSVSLDSVDGIARLCDIVRDEILGSQTGEI